MKTAYGIVVSATVVVFTNLVFDATFFTWVWSVEGAWEMRLIKWETVGLRGSGRASGGNPVVYKSIGFG